MAKADKSPGYALVVIHPFALDGVQYERGQRVTDAEAIASIMASEVKNRCNKVAQ
jgi:hypothetical protein